MRRPAGAERARGGRLAVIAGMVLALSAVPAGPAMLAGSAAQTQDLGGFGGYQVTARGAGFTMAPRLPAVLPVETPAEATLALAVANLSSGGQGYGQASSVFPGSLLVGLRPLLSVGAGFDAPIPDYPLVVESRAHEDAASSRVPGVTMSSNVKPEEAVVTSDLGGFTLPGLIDVGAIRTVSTALVEPGRARSSSSTEIAGVSILDGTIRLDSIVTTSIAESDATSSSCEGGVRIGGASVNGTAVAIDEQGVHADGAPLLPGLDLGVLGVGLLDELGVEIRVLGALESCGGPQADRTTTGVLISLPLPEAGPIPPGGSLDIILGSTSAVAGASLPFEFVMPELPEPDAPAPAAALPSTGSPTPPASPTAAPSAPAPTAAPPAEPPTSFVPSAAAGEPLDFAFAGVPAGLVVGLMLLAVPGSRAIRRYMDQLLSIVTPT